MTEGTTRRLQMYNQAGQLVYETTNVGGVPGDTTEFIYLGRHLIAERKNGSTLTYVHTDALGSVTRKTDALGVRVQDRVYEPFGESLEVTTRAPQWPQGMAYTGHVLDNLTRITYAQARYYDQLMGRFMSVDPVAPDAGSFNRYWYANNNPFSNVDRDGRQAEENAKKPEACRVGDTGCNIARGDRGGSSAGNYRPGAAAAQGKVDGLRDRLGAVARVTDPEGSITRVSYSAQDIIDIYEHLEKLASAQFVGFWAGDDFGPNREMPLRVILGNSDDYTMNFFRREVLEISILQSRISGNPSAAEYLKVQDSAHYETLKAQGMYFKGYDRLLYTPEMIKAYPGFGWSD
ncbi:MAG TPA: RHS repeat-associated core domain-containing protein [Dokdonella sp.]|uniref:RHS repeat-associated core domain-containing protein n=1 Tax=Dokdonella sp. TaxID=2291710 RepID=UPI002C7E3C18|nr:RHS repeat-associated core domain-containing protein [Dokdonella sp.]HUD41091.1 RHS repeat-associated core domain-containing protein [Dokdonella sp.]